MGVWTPGPGPSSGDDLFTGDASEEIADALAGDDTLTGGLGDDTLTGGTGADWLYGGEDDDRLYGSVPDGPDTGSNHLFGEAGDDLIQGFARDEIDGGDGDDLVMLSRSGAAPANVQGGDGVDTLEIGRRVIFDSFSIANGFEYFSGVITGTDGDNLFDLSGVGPVPGQPSQSLTVVAADGQDTMTGSDFHDFLMGGRGNDRLFGMDAHDDLSGGAGADLLNGGQGGDFIYDHMPGYVDGDVDTLLGGAGDDYVKGGIGDILRGNEGVDTVILDLRKQTVAVDLDLRNSASVQSTGSGFFTGMERVDILATELPDLVIGGAYGDAMDGGKGDDTLRGGGGFDFLTGGRGEDLFVYANADLAGGVGDRIKDFNIEVDLIDFGAVDANLLAAGNQAFSFIDQADFHNQAGELRVEQGFGQRWLVMIDRDGDGEADLTIEVDSNGPLTAEVFVL